MCEFCSLGPNTNKDRDSTNPVFSGFFSADAIDSAVRKATEQRQANRDNRIAQRQEDIDNNDIIRNDSGGSMAPSDGSADDEEEDGDDEDDDGT
jgi:hypothetical protein